MALAQRSAFQPGNLSSHLIRNAPLRHARPRPISESPSICVAEVIAVAVLDGESIRGEECSVAQALKMVRPNISIILLEERKRLSNIPEGIDAVVPVGATETLLRKIEELLSLRGQSSRAAS